MIVNNFVQVGDQSDQYPRFSETSYNTDNNEIKTSYTVEFIRDDRYFSKTSGNKDEIRDLYLSLVEEKKSKEHKKATKRIKAAQFNATKYHLFKEVNRVDEFFPIHLICGGEYITEDISNFGNDDLGWFYINSREYELYLYNIIDIDCIIES